jgi:two-component system response regulator HydG
MKYDWPGNVRELREIIRELIAEKKERVLGFDLPEYILKASGKTGADIVNTIEETEKREIVRVLNMTGWNKTQSARILGYRSKQTLYNKMKKYNIQDPRDLTANTD